MDKNFRRSSNGVVVSCASSKTLRLNSSQTEFTIDEVLRAKGRSHQGRRQLSGIRAVFLVTPWATLLVVFRLAIVVEVVSPSVRNC